MLFTSLTAVLTVIIHVRSAVGHPHQLHPLHAHKVRMLQWDLRNANHRDVAPSTTAFQHQGKSQHVPANRLSADPLDKTPVQDVGDIPEAPTRLTTSAYLKIQEATRSHLPRLEPESIQVPSEVPFDPEHNHAFEDIQHGFLPSGVPRGWLEAQQQAKASRARKLKVRKALMARMQALTTTIVEALEDGPSELVLSKRVSKRSPMRFQDYSVKFPTSNLGAKAPRERDPTPFAGNHVGGLATTKHFVPSSVKRSVLRGDGPSSSFPAKSPVAEPEEDQLEDERVI